MGWRLCLAASLAGLAMVGAVLGELVKLCMRHGLAPGPELLDALVIGLAPLPLVCLLPLPFVASRWVRTPDDASALRRSARLLAWLTLIALALPLLYILDRRVVLGLSKLEFVAAAAALTNLVAWLGLAQLVPGLTHLWERALRALGRGPLAKATALLVPPERLGLTLLASASVAALALVLRSREVFAALDWPRGLAVFDGVALGVGLGWSTRRHPRWHVAVWGLALLTALVVVLMPSTRAPWRVGRARDVTYSSRIGVPLLRKLFDRDHDGFLSFAGGGDCAPSDPTRNPAASEIPGDGIDQDCDGRDAALGHFELPTFRSHLSPPDFERRPPLILLLTVDAFNPRRLARFGAARDTMPRLERFMDEAVVFRHAFAQGPSTRLSFPALFSSHWDTEIPRRLEGRHPYPIEDSVTMLAERMKQAGYRTAAIAPTGMFRPPRWKGLLQGVEHSVLAAVPRGSIHAAPQVTDAAVAQMEAAGHSPLFLWVHYYDAHPPHRQPEGVDAYGSDEVDRYDAELTHIDRSLARLFGEIEERYGAAAWIVVTGDHARAFDAPRHTRRGYGYDLYTSVLHVPLAVRIPGLDAHAVDRPVSLLDVTPTLVDLLGLTPEDPHAFRGRSLVPALRGLPEGEPAPLFSQFYIEEKLWSDAEPLLKVSVLTDTRHLILDRTTGRRELYAWRDDPFENHDLKDEEPGVARMLADELAAFVTTVYTPPASAEDDEVEDDGGDVPEAPAGSPHGPGRAVPPPADHASPPAARGAASPPARPRGVR